MSLKTLRGKTAAQLASITDGVTDSDKAYWEAHAYEQIRLMVERFEGGSSIAGGIRSVLDFDNNIQSAIDDLPT
jgi:hypothetical protein